jgi:hypothetical protein
MRWLVNKKNLLLPGALILIILLAISCSGCLGEACEKNYTLTGIVTDSSLTRLEGVEVRWHYDDPAQPIVVLGQTNQQGEYSIDYLTRASLTGSPIEFVKAGYLTVVADPFAVSEAGPDICGSITLRRDAILQLQ